MDPAASHNANRHDTSGSLNSAVLWPQSSERNAKQLLGRPFQSQHGRRYLRDVPYPLPCDLPEIHRQNLKTQLECAVFGRPVCSPNALASPPARVLEVGCGSAYWTARCHEMYSAMGYRDISYTGLDLAPVAPDLRKQGLNWTFVQHDMRRLPWPFEDGSFDLVMLKEAGLAMPVGVPSQRMFDECIRLLCVGGTLEIWESDHIVRSLQPHRPPIGLSDWEQKAADRTATFPMSPVTPFAPAENRYLKAANRWIDKALEQRRLTATPCVRLVPAVLQEPDILGDSGFRRVAIPLSELCWEFSAQLSDDQLALRATALLTVLQLIEGLEPLLKEVSGKNTEEWSYWWASMMGDLYTPSERPLNGECLEIGASWATKLI